MDIEDKNWFIRDRSEALASLLLTSRDDVKVRTQSEADNGVDIVVEIKDNKNRDILTTKVFFVQVKGTASSNRNEWMEGVKQLFPPSGLFLPVCLFVVNIRENTAEYSWLAEPLIIDAKNVSLNFLEKGDFHPLDKKAVDEMVDRVSGWYNTRSSILHAPRN